MKVQSIFDQKGVFMNVTKRSVFASASLGLLLISGGRLHGSVPSPYTLTVEVTSQGPKGVLTLQLDAKIRIPSATVVIRGSKNVLVGNGEQSVNLDAGGSTRIPTALEWGQSPEPIGYVTVRVLVGTTEIGYSANIYYVGMIKGQLSLLDESQREALGTAWRTALEAADARQRAEILVPLLRSRGRRLVPAAAVAAAPGLSAPGSTAAASAADKAFDAAIGPNSIEPCLKHFYESASNTYYHLTGSPKYADPVFGPANALGAASAAGDNPFTVTTQVELENECGESTVVTRYFTSTSNGGAIDVWVLSIAPAGTNPIVTFSTICPDAGVIDNGAFATSEQTLSGTDIVGSFSAPVTWNLDNTTYVDGPTRAYLFLWQSILRGVKQSWRNQSSQFDGVTGSFRASYDPSLGGNNAFFNPTYTSVVFPQGASWASKYLVAHETGHFLQFNLQGGNLPVVPSAWNQIDPTTADIAFLEGFADFCAAVGAWDGQSSFPVARGGQYQPPQFCESGECHRLVGTGTGETWTLNITGFFRDLFDSTSSPTWDTLSGQQVDYVALPLSLLLSWRSSSPYYSHFQAFFDDFASRGLFSPNCPAVQTLENLNGMAIAGCP